MKSTLFPIRLILLTACLVLGPVIARGEVVPDNLSIEFDEECDDGRFCTVTGEYCTHNAQCSSGVCSSPTPGGCNRVDYLTIDSDQCMDPANPETCVRNEVATGWTCPVDDVCDFECGNGVLDGVCSDNGHPCTVSNVPPSIGKSNCFHPNSAKCVTHEECDASSNCTSQCIRTGSLCGDGFINSNNEECDDYNTNSGDGCTFDCLKEGTILCGNGIIDTIYETCDNGGLCSDNATYCTQDSHCGANTPCTLRNGDGCSSNCLIESGCGDGIVGSGETSDLGIYQFPLVSATGWDDNVANCNEMHHTDQRALPIMQTDMFGSRLVASMFHGGLSVWQVADSPPSTGDHLPYQLGSRRHPDQLYGLAEREQDSVAVEGRRAYIASNMTSTSDSFQVYDLVSGNCHDGTPCFMRPGDAPGCGANDFCRPRLIGTGGTFPPQIKDSSGTGQITLNLGTLYAVDVDHVTGANKDIAAVAGGAIYNGWTTNYNSVFLYDVSSCANVGAITCGCNPTLVSMVPTLGLPAYPLIKSNMLYVPDSYFLSTHFNPAGSWHGALRIFNLANFSCKYGDQLEMPGTGTCDLTGSTCATDAVCVPDEIGQIPLNGMVFSVTLQNDVAYVATGGPMKEPYTSQFAGAPPNRDRDGAGLAVVDVSNPANPVLRGTMATPGISTFIKVRGNRAYIADDTNGLVVADITGCSTGSCNPRIIGGYRTSAMAGDPIQGEAWDVELVGNKAILSGAFIDTQAGYPVHCATVPGFTPRRFTNFLVIDISEEGLALSNCVDIQDCGDGDVEGSELCDDGANNGTGSGYCEANCLSADDCGNGVLDAGETCDDGPYNGAGSEYCNSDCTGTHKCGDDIQQAGEACDDGPDNGMGSGYCNVICAAIEGTPVAIGCGNCVLEYGEVCDDGNTDDWDGCHSDCSGYEEGCGDGFADTVTEFCDDGNFTSDGEGQCLANCQGIETCGDGDPEGSEICDDGAVIRYDADPFTGNYTNPYDFVVVGSYMYVMSQSHGVEMWDMSAATNNNPYNVEESFGATHPGTIEFLVGDKLVAAAGIDGVGILDISGYTVSLSGAYTGIDYAVDVKVDSANGLAYVTGVDLPSYDGYFYVLDVSGSAPTLVDSKLLPSSKPGFSIFLDGTTAYVAGGENGLISIDISSCATSSPCLPSSWTTTYPIPTGYISTNPTDQAWGLVIDGNFAYVSWVYSGVQVVKTNGTPQTKAFLSLPGTSPYLMLRGSTLYGTGNDEGLRVMTVSGSSPYITLDSTFRVGDANVVHPYGASDLLVSTDDFGILHLTGSYLAGGTCAWGCHCGNGTVENPEACDEGVDNGTSGHCNTTCSGMVP